MNISRITLKLRKRMRKYAMRPDAAIYYNYLPVAAGGADGLDNSPKSLKQLWKERFRPPEKPFKLWKWDGSLNYGEFQGDTVVCWCGLKKVDSARQAALRLDGYFKTFGLRPVLVTAMADFAFYVRLGWPVEYLPPFSSAYARKKARYLALRYRSAFFIPLEAGLGRDDEIADVLRGILEPCARR